MNGQTLMEATTTVYATIPDWLFTRRARVLRVLARRTRPRYYNQIYNWTNMSWNYTVYSWDARALVLLTERVIVGHTHVRSIINQIIVIVITLQSPPTRDYPARTGAVIIRSGNMTELKASHGCSVCKCDDWPANLNLHIEQSILSISK